MRLETPSWWYDRKPSRTAKVLKPFSWVWGTIAGSRMTIASSHYSNLPVLCIGNFTMGGAGKTPTAIYVANHLKSLGEQPAFLSRGYGGRLSGPHRVNAEIDTAEMVGDEPLLLARHAPTFIARKRVAGAKLIEQSNATIIIMDDGFQNNSLHKDLSLVVIDGDAGIGNGMTIPSGPLRAPFEDQIAFCDAIIIISKDAKENDDNGKLRKSFSGPVMYAETVPDEDISWLRTARIIAFAGIGRPEKFFQTVRRCTPNLIDCIAFPDHHDFSENDARDLLGRAFGEDAVLLTTEKDWVRLTDNQSALSELRENAQTLPIRLEFEKEDLQQLDKLIDVALSTRQDR